MRAHAHTRSNIARCLCAREGCGDQEALAVVQAVAPGAAVRLQALLLRGGQGLHGVGGRGPRALLRSPTTEEEPDRSWVTLARGWL